VLFWWVVSQVIKEHEKHKWSVCNSCHVQSALTKENFVIIQLAVIKFQPCWPQLSRKGGKGGRRDDSLQQIKAFFTESTNLEDLSYLLSTKWTSQY
jgi:hypothetical protein